MDFKWWLFVMALIDLFFLGLLLLLLLMLVLSLWLKVGRALSDGLYLVDFKRLLFVMALIDLLHLDFLLLLLLVILVPSQWLKAGAPSWLPFSTLWEGSWSE